METENINFAPKQLPTNLEAEQAVLAAVLMNNRALEKFGEYLKSDHFTHPAHKEIYKLMDRQFAAGFPVDIITIKNYLEQQGVLESVGGTDYLAQLAGAGTSVVNVEQYARIVYDNAMRRELIGIGQGITDNAFVEDLDKPVSSQIEDAEKKLFDLSTSGASVDKGAQTLGESLRAALEAAEIAYKADGKLSGLTTGFRDLDKSVSGLHNSDLIIIAGRPAMGKTTVAINMAFSAANAIKSGNANKNYKGAVVFFSLEMSASQLAARVLSSQSEIPSSSMRNGNLTDSDFLKMSQYSDALSSVPLFFDDTPGMSVPMMRTRARRLARKHGGLALIVIDYLQLMTSPGGRRNENRVQELSEITRGLKMLAKELDVPVIALSQLSRNVESKDRTDKRPQLSDLRESGSIEQDADIVMFTYREEYYLQGRDPMDKISGRSDMQLQKEHEDWKRRLDQCRGKAELIIGKNRHGKPDTIRLEFHSEYSLFKDDDSAYGSYNAPQRNNYGPPPAAPNSAPIPADIPAGPAMDDIPDDMM
ncbi:MAG: replicative DNA helicase [Alphaproteobacteria bacterium]|nr:replicative DNA helicase [Alphaproteobacteria bacterium]